MDASKPGTHPKDDFQGADMTAAHDDAIHNTEKQVNDKAYSGLGYSDLEVVQTPGLEVAGSDTSQAIPPPLYRPKFKEQQSFAEQSLPEVNYHPVAAPYSPNPLSGSTANEYHYNGGNNPFNPSANDPDKDPRIWGLRRRVFWIVFAVALLGIVLAIAVGLGVGLGLKSTNDSSASANSTSTSAPNATTSSSTTALPAATATATLTSDTDIICPEANRTLYSDPSSTTGQKFLLLCGRDYNSNQGAVDLASTNTTTVEECVSNCGNTEGCVAVGWGIYYGVGTCWLKSAIGTPNVSPNWYAAVVDSSG